jgi:2-desacetyl-2-hydroxyethyl bacteriochlorophyllide A dehydrogenase
VRAAVLRAIPAEKLHVVDVPEPEIEGDDLLMEVAACGICGTDLHILEGASYRPSLPFVLGHEPVGVIVRAGPLADASLVGRLVTITLFIGDGTCAYCRDGDQRLCQDLKGITGVFARPGGFAERLAVRTDQVVVLPSGLDAVIASTLVDGGATAVNSVRVAASLLDRAPLETRSRLTVVVGAGPIGIFVAELLREAGRPHVLVQESAVRREAASAMGHPVVGSLDEIDEPPAAVIECAGASSSLRWAFDRLLPHGAYVAAGYGLVPGLSLALAARKELSVTGVRSGRREDLVKILDLVASGVVRPPSVATWPLASINDSIDALRSKTLPGKAVVVP